MAFTVRFFDLGFNFQPPCSDQSGVIRTTRRRMLAGHGRMHGCKPRQLEKSAFVAWSRSARIGYMYAVPILVMRNQSTNRGCSSSFEAAAAVVVVASVRSPSLFLWRSWAKECLVSCSMLRVWRACSVTVHKTPTVIRSGTRQSSVVCMVNSTCTYYSA